MTYKVTVKQVNELTDYVEADSKEMAEYIAKQRVGKGVYNLDDAEHAGEVVITAEETDDASPSEVVESDTPSDNEAAVKTAAQKQAENMYAPGPEVAVPDDYDDVQRIIKDTLGDLKGY